MIAGVSALEVYAAAASTVALVAAALLCAGWWRSRPRLRVASHADTRVGHQRVTVSNVGRMATQIQFLQVVAERPGGELVAMNTGETYATKRQWPFILDAGATEEWVVDWRSFVGATDTVTVPRAVVVTSGRGRVWSPRRQRRRR